MRQRSPCAICSSWEPSPVHPSCWHAAIAADWLLYGYLGSRDLDISRDPRSGSQESTGTTRKKPGGFAGGGDGGGGGGDDGGDGGGGGGAGGDGGGDGGEGCGGGICGWSPWAKRHMTTSDRCAIASDRKKWPLHAQVGSFREI